MDEEMDKDRQMAHHTISSHPRLTAREGLQPAECFDSQRGVSILLKV
jgi:hypothetical protein